MKKNRILAIEYIRGISMLGVIGIHTGSQYLSNPASNMHLIALFEILTRFSVPIFFFISAFGLFYNIDLSEKFSYKNFMTKRFKTVLIPYLVWSFLYITHYTILYHDTSLLSIPTLIKFLFFGFASYQLYFLVILLWFYALMPVWIYMIRHMNAVRMVMLLLFQLAFDYYSSFIMNPYSIENPVIKALFEYRLNYWVLHYIFIFLFGGYLAIHYDKFEIYMSRHYNSICSFFIASLSSLVIYYYYLIYEQSYSLEAAINTAHQLCPAGIFYTIGASLFFFTLFSNTKFPVLVHSILAILGKHSYFAYLFHPFAITYLAMVLTWQGKIMTAPIAIMFYFSVTIISIAAAALFRKIGTFCPLINSLLIGIYPKNK